MLTPKEVSEHVFARTAMGGYNMKMVDEFLDELTQDYASIYGENVTLKEKMKVLIEKIEEYRSTEDSMRTALLTAQKMADSMTKEAEDKKMVILESAEAEARRRTSMQDKVMEETQRKIGELREETAAFVAKVRELYKRELRILDELSNAELCPSSPTRRAELNAEVDEMEENIAGDAQILNAGSASQRTPPVPTAAFEPDAASSQHGANDG